MEIKNLLANLTSHADVTQVTSWRGVGNSPESRTLLARIPYTFGQNLVESQFFFLKYLFYNSKPKKLI